jgi:glucose/arabinose dehydrogenase
VFITASCVKAQPSFQFREIKSGLHIPWEIVYGPDDHIWFTQKNGYVMRLDPLSGDMDTLIAFPDAVANNEGGVLGMALHPEFADSPFVYVAYEYNNPSSQYTEKIVKLTYNGTSLGSPVILLDNIKGSSIHNGCRLLIGPDQTLFITTGDAADQSNPQNLASINGKILRIHLDGSIPADNPIPGSPLWSWGHRNAQGLTWAGEKLFASEHGPTTDDEINLIQKGRNYGWPTVKGFCNEPAEQTFCADSNVVEPLYAWTPTIATSGMEYYMGDMFPLWNNSLLLGTLKNEQLLLLHFNAGTTAIAFIDTIIDGDFGRIRDICAGPHGNIFISTSNSTAGTSADKIIEFYDPNYIPTGVTGIHLNENAFMVYPNPVADMVNIRRPVQQTAPFNYVVWDMLGRSWVTGKSEDPQTRVDMSTLPAGWYVLKIYQGMEEYRFKLLR